MGMILGRKLIQTQPQQNASLSTALRTTFADYPCEFEYEDGACGILAWAILGEGPEEKALCFDHGVEELSRRVRKLLNGAWESK